MQRSFDPVTLQLFVAVCEEGNIARAAEREAIVASAVSKRIAAVERDLGTPLLVRGRRGIRPTPAGETLLRQARELLSSLDRMRAELSGFATGVQGSVRVMASVSALAGRLPDDIAGFVTRHRRASVSIGEATSVEILRALHDGAADVGVLWDASDLGGLAAKAYRGDRLCVALPRDHPLAGQPRLRFVDVVDEPWIGVAPGGMMETLLRRQAAAVGRTMACPIQVSSMDAACRIVIAGLGIAILPEPAAQAFAPALAAVPLAETWARRRFVVAARPERLLPAIARLLVEHLTHAAATDDHAAGAAPPVVTV